LNCLEASLGGGCSKIFLDAVVGHTHFIILMTGRMTTEKKTSLRTTSTDCKPLSKRRDTLRLSLL
jgi:hypothetical protein